jgi:ribose transport system substrate-binding protein
VSVVSADNFGLGTIGAQLLSPHVAKGGKVGILSYQADFFATNEREIAFRKWMASERPDLRLNAVKFPKVGAVADVLHPFLDVHPDLAGLFAVWDVPAMEAVNILRARAQPLPMTTIDLGIEVAVALACGDIIKGVGAQRAYDQGVAVTKATIASLVGRDPPSWVVLPGLATTPETVADTYRRIWHEPPPSEVLAARRSQG